MFLRFVLLALNRAGRHAADKLLLHQQEQDNQRCSGNRHARQQYAPIGLERVAQVHQTGRNRAELVAVNEDDGVKGYGDYQCSGEPW